MSGWTLAVVLVVEPAVKTEPVGKVVTAFSTLLTRLGLGLGTMDQAVPFHSSVMVFSAPPTKAWPTAQTSLLDIAETPRRMLVEALVRLGLGTMVQLVPSQCSVRVVLL